MQVWSHFDKISYIYRLGNKLFKRFYTGKKTFKQILNQLIINSEEQDTILITQLILRFGEEKNNFFLLNLAKNLQKL